MVVKERTASSRQLAARWSTVTGVQISASSIRQRLLHRGLRARVLLYRISLTANYRWLRLQWTRIPGAIFYRDNACPYVAKTVRELLFSLTHATSSLTCSLDMSPIEHVWDLVGGHLARDSRSAAS
ncbi:transposable element Tcb1 transposase [Trichonephila clavipes]|nr:transposable element Tcb1 transposase [Trichonephila clavipes]